MSLIKLTDYKTVSEKILLQTFNSMLGAVDDNFQYTLNQLQFTLPSPQLGDVGKVLSILDAGTSPIYKYEDVNSLVNLQTIFTNHTLTSYGIISLRTPFEFNLNSNIFPLSNFSISGRTGYGTGAIKNKVEISQISTDGDLNEEHFVGSFSLVANTINLTTNTGQVNVNKLKVNDYVLPLKGGEIETVLQMGEQGVLKFASVPNHIQYGVVDGFTSYTLKENKVFVFYGLSHRPTLAFNNLAAGFLFTDELDPHQTLSLKMGGKTLFKASYTVSGHTVGSNVENINLITPYLKFESATILTTINSLVSEGSNSNAYEGSLWYDKSGKSLVVIAENGEKLFIKGQASAESVNTQEEKSFIMHPGAALVLGEGTEQSPTLKVGNAGIVGSGPEMKLVVRGKAVAKLTESVLQSAGGSSATAKIVLDDAIGINNPSEPAYTFANADSLGIYRSNLNAVAVAVKGAPVVEFTELGLDVKSLKITNVDNPTEPKDVANKEYVDSIMPYGITPGALVMVNSVGDRYMESGAKYSAGTMELKSENANTALKLVSKGGGSVIIKTPTTSQHITFALPLNQLNNGILQVDSLGNTAWVSKESITTGLFKADGSVPMTSGIKVTVNTNKKNLLISSGTAGIYASDGSYSKVGMAAKNIKLLEVDCESKTLTGYGTSFNAPLIRLDSTLSNYSVSTTDSQPNAVPTYSFIGEPGTGIGQTTIQGVSMLVGGLAKLTVNGTGVIAHDSRIQNVSNPVQDKDAATKEYVDNAVKNPVEMSFSVNTLPVGYSSGSSIILSLYDKALIYQSSSVNLTYESDVDPATILIPSNFRTNAKCQVYINGWKMSKALANNGIRQAGYLNERAILLNYEFLTVGATITVQIA